MSLPARLKDIKTNMSRKRLRKVIIALRNNRVLWGEPYENNTQINFLYNINEFILREEKGIVASITHIRCHNQRKQEHLTFST